MEDGRLCKQTPCKDQGQKNNNLLGHRAKPKRNGARLSSFAQMNFCSKSSMKPLERAPFKLAQAKITSAHASKLVFELSLETSNEICMFL